MIDRQSMAVYQKKYFFGGKFFLLAMSAFSRRPAAPMMVVRFWLSIDIPVKFFTPEHA